jgi:hypothetical protein
VDFLSRGNGYVLSLTAREAVFAFHGGRGGRTHDEGDIPPRTAVLHMEIDGAGGQAKAHALDELPGKVNDFVGNDSTRLVRLSTPRTSAAPRTTRLRESRWTALATPT